MGNIEHLRFFAQKVLPTVYDNSLSYYEVLGKIAEILNEIVDVTNDVGDYVQASVDKWLDEHPEATTTVQDGSIGKIKLTDALYNVIRSKPFYIVTEYDIAPNSGDVYETLNSFLWNTVEPTGGVVFFPEGVYEISDTIAVPPNTIIMGGGYNSVIYYNETGTRFGVALTNGGDNVGFVNIRVEHKTTGDITLESQTGGIGLSSINGYNFDPSQPSASWIRRNSKNLFVFNLWSDSRYPLQVEGGSGYSVEDVYISNVFAPNGLVSEASAGVGKNIYFNNIRCDTIRCGFGRHTSVNVRLSDFYCHHLHISDKRISACDGMVDCSGVTKNSFDYGALLSDGITLNNVEMLGGNAQYAYAVMGNNANEPANLFGCKISGFPALSTNAVGTNIACTYFINCYVDWTGSGRHTLKGWTLGGDFRYMSSSVLPFYYLNETHDIPAAITNFTTSNLSSTRFPPVATVNGSTVTLKQFRVLANLPEDNAIFRIASTALEMFAPAGTKIPVTLWSYPGDTVNFSMVEIDENGNGILKTSGLTLSNYYAYMIDTTYELPNVV